MSKDDQKYFDQGSPGAKSNGISENTIEARPPYTFKNGVVYNGHWKGNIREGYGLQTWPDGAKY